MLPEMRPYSGGPTSAQEIAVLTQTEIVTLEKDPGGATGSEYSNSRLMNFLSDDAAPRERDLDTLMSTAQYSKYDEGPPPPPAPEVGDLSAPPPEVEPITLPPLEQLFSEQVQQEQDDDLYRGASIGSYAQEMYTATRDLLSEVAA